MQSIVCEVCQRSPQVSQSRSHSNRATKRIVRPNLQKFAGFYLCTRCIRTQTKKRGRANLFLAA